MIDGTKRENKSQGGSYISHGVQGEGATNKLSKGPVFDFKRERVASIYTSYEALCIAWEFSKTGKWTVISSKYEIS